MTNSNRTFDGKESISAFSLSEMLKTYQLTGNMNWLRRYRAAVKRLRGF